jgi:TPR repeat protein
MQVVARSPAPGEARMPFEPARDRETLPHGFVPVDAVRSLPMMGRWSPLPDGMPPWLPFNALVEMARREHAGDEDARAWLELYRHAVQGEVASQAAMARACEAGDAGIDPDIPRAFFWYYRAALAGDVEASESVLRLKEASDIPEAAMAEPALVYPGQWRWWREEPDRPGTRRIVELAADGSFKGAGMNGLWSYDHARRTVTLAHHETWRVRILGCRESTLFGRDARGAACILERTGPSR